MSIRTIDINLIQRIRKNKIYYCIEIKIEISFIERYRGSKSNFLSIINYLSKFGYYLISISKIKYLKNMNSKNKIIIFL